MTSRIDTLLENEEIKTFLENNNDAIMEAEMAIGEFPKILKNFIMEHPQEFIAENLDETKKNIRVFSEVATAQFITEVTNMYATEVEIVQEEVQEKLNDYI